MAELPTPSVDEFYRRSIRTSIESYLQGEKPQSWLIDEIKAKYPTRLVTRVVENHESDWTSPEFHQERLRWVRRELKCGGEAIYPDQPTTKQATTVPSAAETK